MGTRLDQTNVDSPATIDPLLRGFARRLLDHYHARLYLFGSRARGTQQAESDYDLIAVASSFAGVSMFRRCLDRDSHWLAAGGWRLALDLHCYSPEEFRQEKAGLGFLAHAYRQGELFRVAPVPKEEFANSSMLARQS